MGKCPSRRNCTGVDRELLIAHGVPSERLEHHYGSEKMRLEHCICDERGTIPDQWQECEKYASIPIDSPIEIAKKENCNMKIGIVIGVVIGIIMGILGIIEREESIAIIGFIICPIYGIGISSISVTINAIEDFIESLFGGTGCLITILLWLFAMPYLFGFGVISIVGIVRYFKRRHLLQ